MREILLKGSQFQWSPVKMRGLPRWRTVSIEICLHAGLLQGGLSRWRSASGESASRGVCFSGLSRKTFVSKRFSWRDVRLQRVLPRWGSSSKDDRLDGRQPRRELSLDGGLPQWRSVSMEVCLNGGPSRWRSSSRAKGLSEALLQSQDRHHVNENCTATMQSGPSKHTTLPALQGSRGGQLWSGQAPSAE